MLNTVHESLTSLRSCGSRFMMIMLNRLGVRLETSGDMVRVVVLLIEMLKITGSDLP
jgi:hypothetical protein